MRQVLTLKISIIKKVALLAVVIVLIAYLFGYANFAFGFLYGAVLAALNWLLLANTIEKSTTYNPRKAQFFAVFHYLVRLTIIFIAIYIAAMRQDMHVLGPILALLLPKVVIFWEYVVSDYITRYFNRYTKG